MVNIVTLNVDWLKEKKIRGVVQVGIGYGSAEFPVWNHANIKNQIYIEAYPDYKDEVINNSARLACEGAKIKCYSAALTNKVGKTTFYINVNTLSHSVLKMDDDRPEVVKWMHSIGEVEVDAITLDSIFEDPELNPEDYNLLFLDTQSSEHLIIEGAKNTLHYFDYIQVEISTRRVYADSLIYDEWVPMMDKLGYDVLSYLSGFYNDDKNEEVSRETTFIKKSLT